MLKITILKVGKLKSEYTALEAEFLKRLSSFAKVEMREIKESKKEVGPAIEEESTALCKHLPQDSYIIALDREGKQFSSEEFAQVIKTQRDFGKTQITFVIGGPYGLSQDLMRKAHLRLSFSRLTFTHQFAYVILLEQIFRASTIISGKKYHY
ncbi:MAG: hypothetical protein ACD_51C00065G0009 [uncultured bacterium]|nr:MAG: hypothetical protein ACD_51C00065G0009 [uncultured bacterium]OGJ47727.1 MAG: hypothetical protein A2244_03810 [Candidatus Peregrinibacteria bacterium RIFOXYA2_FULL_41_18]OGJ48162.1 MAG: hypothetical protein A2344_05615 [Candidatus Peregrinibacteria bacterium RIFOXYB12_FULL_41_12]OGJ54491.1 MAG: hypothetical protein A2336_05545 [Candidatus Peregrinibacteria bacterium RIFOXYB2_FULL_41_88]